MADPSDLGHQLFPAPHSHDGPAADRETSTCATRMGLPNAQGVVIMDASP